MVERQLVNLNGNMLCSVDCETTGLDPYLHEIIEICVLPLNSEYKPMRDIMPFHAVMKPDRPEQISNKAMKVNHLSLSELMGQGLDQFQCADFFCEWFDNLRLAVGKKISPLGQNYCFDQAFIKRWLGIEAYQDIFHYHYRDTMHSALFLNDYATQQAEKTPYPKVNLAYLCSQLNVVNPDAHSALGDAIATAEVYRKMLMRGTLI